MEGSTADGVLAPLPGRCAFYVVKKKRYCKMIVGSGKTFCGEHANAVRYNVHAGPALYGCAASYLAPIKTT